MIYLDNAATSFQKPISVKKRVIYSMENFSSPGRGGYPAAMRAAECEYHCRELAAKLFNCSDPEKIVITSSATHGLNIAIKSLVHKGSRVVISGYEHNAVLRPLHAIGADLTVASSPLFDAESAFQAFASAIEKGTDVVVCNHVSNVFGFVLPVNDIAELCKSKGVPMIVDASQSAGTIDVDFEKLSAQFVAMPGHKGLYGPQGTGLLLCKDTAVPIMEGGTGGNSLMEDMPDFLPDRLEAGTHNMCGIAGLDAGLAFVIKKTPEAIRAYEYKLSRILIERLKNINRAEVFEAKYDQSAVFSFRVRGIDSEILADSLGRQGVAVRAGLHCAPLAHKTVGTVEGGTVRISPSVFNTTQEVLKAAEIIEQTVKKLR